MHCKHNIPKVILIMCINISSKYNIESMNPINNYHKKLHSASFQKLDNPGT